MDAVKEQLQQLNGEVINEKARLQEVMKELRKEPENQTLLFERNWLIQTLADLDARRKNLEERLSDAATACGPESVGAGADTTAAYPEACLTPFDADKLRQGEGLSCVEEPLQPRLPLSLCDANRLLNQRAELRNLLVSPVDEPQAATAYDLCRHVGYVVASEPVQGPTEVFTVVNTAMVVDRTLGLIANNVPGPTIRIGRNSVDTSGATGKCLRPDFMCWVNGALLFKGEEKAAEDDMDLAVKELGDKMAAAWDEGVLPGVQAPCMLAFAAAGQVLQFFCIKRSGDEKKPRVEPISLPMKLNLAAGRARAVNTVCNVYRLMVGVAGTLPRDVPFALGTVIKNGPSSVMLLQGFIRKTIHDFRTNHAAFAAFELLQAVYAAMSKPEHKRCIIQACGPDGGKGPVLRNANYLVHLAPVGVRVSGPPDTESELARALHGALTGLAALHSEGFVHRDVRWANLIKLPAEDRWLLVDLEHAGRVGDDCSQPPYPLRFWTSDMLFQEKFWTAASDLKLLAQQLLSSLPFELSSEGSDLRRLLCKGTEPAVGALQHKWFAMHIGV